jgi:hypothetical protein
VGLRHPWRRPLPGDDQEIRRLLRRLGAFTTLVNQD